MDAAGAHTSCSDRLPGDDPVSQPRHRRHYRDRDLRPRAGSPQGTVPGQTSGVRTSSRGFADSLLAPHHRPRLVRRLTAHGQSARIAQAKRTRQSRRCFRDAGRFPHRQAACRQSPVAFERRCIPAELPRSARLIVALRSKYTRASSPGGGSSLARLVSRAPRPHREDWPLSALTPLRPQAAGGAKRCALRATLFREERKLRPAPHPRGASRRELTLADSRHPLPRTKPIADPANTKRSNAE